MYGLVGLVLSGFSRHDILWLCIASDLFATENPRVTKTREVYSHNALLPTVVRNGGSLGSHPQSYPGHAQTDGCTPLSKSRMFPLDRSVEQYELKLSSDSSKKIFELLTLVYVIPAYKLYLFFCGGAYKLYLYLHSRSCCRWSSRD
jgi:hypothetical protein